MFQSLYYKPKAYLERFGEARALHTWDMFFSRAVKAESIYPDSDRWPDWEYKELAETLALVGAMAPVGPQPQFSLEKLSEGATDPSTRLSYRLPGSLAHCLTNDMPRSPIRSNLEIWGEGLLHKIAEIDTINPSTIIKSVVGLHPNYGVLDFATPLSPDLTLLMCT